MKKRFLDYDPETNTTEYLHLDGTGKAVLESIQDCQDSIELNTYEAEFFDKKQEYWKVGNIPLTVCYEWAKESGTRPFTKAWQEYAKKKLNSADYRKLNQNKIKL